METLVDEIRTRVGRRAVAAAGGMLLVLTVVAVTPQLLGSHVAAAFGALDDASPRWLWLAGAGFALSLVGSAASWRSAMGLCGGRVGLGDACARYGAGSLVNTFVPARAGDALRIALFSRVLPNRERLWTTGGAFAALGAARSIVLAGFVVAGAVAGALPLWPVLLLLGLAGAAIAISLKVRGREARGRLSHVLDAFRALGHDPRAGLRLVGWIAFSLGWRLTAATAIGASLGIRHPLLVGLVIVPALDLAGTVPLTPGNVGVTSGAVAMAFQTQGVSFTHGLAAGIAFHAVETAVGITFGTASLVWLAPYPTPGVRRIALLAAATSACVGLVGAFSATVLVSFV